MQRFLQFPSIGEGIFPSFTPELSLDDDTLIARETRVAQKTRVRTIPKDEVTLRRKKWDKRGLAITRGVQVGGGVVSEWRRRPGGASRSAGCTNDFLFAKQKLPLRSVAPRKDSGKMRTRRFH